MTAANLAYESVTPDERHALTALCMEYVWRLDHGHAATVWALFTPDGACHLPWGVMRGEAELKAAWAARAQRPVRTRHMIANTRFARRSDDEIEGVISLALYAAEPGEPAPTSPAYLGEHHDIYRRDGEGRWRIHSRRFERAFEPQSVA